MCAFVTFMYAYMVSDYALCVGIEAEIPRSRPHGMRKDCGCREVPHGYGEHRRVHQARVTFDCVWNVVGGRWDCYSANKNLVT